MSQLSLFAADQAVPAPVDLAGLLAASGQLTRHAGGVRVSVVVAAQWRAEALVQMIRATGLTAQIGLSEEGNPLVGTQAGAALEPLAREWLRGAIKAPPDGWVPGARALRMWVLAGGHADGRNYLLDLDPHAPDSAAPLAVALMRAGVAPTVTAGRGRGGAALRVSGHRRLLRLAESIGPPPDGADPAADWPRP